LESLRGAEASNSLGCETAGQLFRAMTLRKLGRRAEAADLLRQVEARLAQPLERLYGDYWWQLGYCQLALDEARQLLGETNVPAVKPTSTPR